MNPEAIEILNTIIKAIMTYIVIEALLGLAVISLIVWVFYRITR